MNETLYLKKTRNNFISSSLRPKECIRNVNKSNIDISKFQNELDKNQIEPLENDNEDGDEDKEEQEEEEEAEEEEEEEDEENDQDEDEEVNDQEKLEEIDLNKNNNQIKNEKKDEVEDKDDVDEKDNQERYDIIVKNKHIINKPIRDSIKNEYNNKSILSSNICLLYGPFPNQLPTIFFDYPSNIKENRMTSLNESLEKIKKINISNLVIYYKLHWERNCIKNIFDLAGLKRTKKGNWHVAWTKHLKYSIYKTLHFYQKVNHFPDSWILGRKDRLLKLMLKMKSKYNLEYNFIPESYLIPKDKKRLKNKLIEKPYQLWIIKPPASSCGRGIYLLTSKNLQKSNLIQLNRDKKEKISNNNNNNNLMLINKKKNKTKNKKKKKKNNINKVIQSYIMNPYLINNYKFDLRIYVLVTSLDPLRIYLHNDGIVRFCSVPYSTENKDINNIYRHVTNFSINKENKNSSFTLHSSEDNNNNNNKWNLQELMSYLEKSGKDTLKIKNNIKDVVCKTIIAAHKNMLSFMKQHVTYPANCFELFGFDLLLDENLKIWLIEVNISPSLMSGSLLDNKIKTILVSDIFHLIGIPVLYTDIDPNDNNGANSNNNSSHNINYEYICANTNLQKIFKNGGNLDTSNLHLLNDKDWYFIHSIENEINRKGNFECIFPNIQTYLHYLPYFNKYNVPYSNQLLYQWLIYKNKIKNQNINKKINQYNNININNHLKKENNNSTLTRSLLLFDDKNKKLLHEDKNMLNQFKMNLLSKKIDDYTSIQQRKNIFINYKKKEKNYLLKKSSSMSKIIPSISNL